MKDLINKTLDTGFRRELNKRLPGHPEDGWCPVCHTDAVMMELRTPVADPVWTEIRDSLWG